MAYETVLLKGKYTTVTGMPVKGIARIAASEILVDDSEDEVLAVPGAVALGEDGSFNVELPAADGGISPSNFTYTLTVVITQNPRQELPPVTFTLLTSEADQVEVDDGEGGTVTVYEKDITDFM